jgi:chromosome segregation ATPase
MKNEWTRQLAEKDREIAEWKAAWETENAAVKKAEREIARLSSDLSANATMLARQCDLAREAEREALDAKRELAQQASQIESLSDSEINLGDNEYACSNTVFRHVIDLRGEIAVLVKARDFYKQEYDKHNKLIIEQRQEIEKCLCIIFAYEIDKKELNEHIAMLKAEIKQWELIVVTHVEEIERLKAECNQWHDLWVRQVVVHQSSQEWEEGE